MCCIPLRLRYLVFCVLISRLDVGVGRHTPNMGSILRVLSNEYQERFTAAMPPS